MRWNRVGNKMEGRNRRSKDETRSAACEDLCRDPFTKQAACGERKHQSVLYNSDCVISQEVSDAIQAAHTN